MNDKLVKIQAELKAPKGQMNNFGGYKYRSCEDILEAVKPLLKKHELTIVITDDVVNVGQSNYIKATIRLSDGNDTIECGALAREAVAKKGMDDAQITGSASSYARKYALNGLFAIDDTKDADTQDNTSYTPAKPKFAADELSEAKADLRNSLEQAGHNNNVKMTVFIKKVLGKNTVDSLGDVDKVLTALMEEK